MSEHPWSTLREALVETQRLQNALDAKSDDMAGMLEGRLRKVSSWKLKRLKKELSQFNARTGRWSS